MYPAETHHLQLKPLQSFWHHHISNQPFHLH